MSPPTVTTAPSWSASAPTTTRAASCSRAERGRGARSSPRRARAPVCSPSCATRAVPRRRAAREHARVPVRARAARRWPARPSSASTRPRRGDELAGDIRHTDCQLIVTDRPRSRLSTALDLGVGARSDRSIADVAGLPRRGRGHADDGDCAGTLPGSRRPVRADLHVGLDRRAQGGADDPGPRRPHAPARVPFSADDVLYSAMPLFHGNALNATVFPALRVRRDHRAAAQVLGVGVPARRPRATARRSSTPSAGRSPTSSRHRADRARPRPLAQVRARPRDRPRPTRSRSPERFGVPLFEGYGSSENAIIILPRARHPAGRSGVPSDGEDIAVVSTPRPARSAHGPASTRTAGC